MRYHLTRSVLFLSLAMPAALLAQDRQTDRDAFTLSERIPNGSWIRVRNLNGAVHVRASSGDKVEITARKNWRRGDPRDVTVETKKASDGSILICAIWANTRTTCTEDRYSTRGDDRDNDRDRNDVSLEFDVRVPRGVRVGAWTVNGGVSVEGATSEVRAGTVNGGVEATSSGGPVQATTVNGSVNASMGRLDGNQDLEFSTVNGSVTVNFAGDIDADVELTTVHGRFETDWPVTISGRIDPRHLRAKIGRGGRRITLTTVNGNVELRKR